MRIALVGPYHPELGGVQVYTTMLAKELRARGHKVTVVTYSGASPVAGERVVTVPRVGVRGVRGAIFILSSALQLARLRPDVALAQYASTSGVAAALASVAGLRYVVTVHGSDWVLGRRLTKFASSRASATVTVSTWLREEMSSEGIEVRRVIPGGIDPSFYSYLPERDRAKEMVGMEGSSVLSVGSLTRAKGMDLIPEVARKLVDEMDVNFYVAGEGPLRSEIEAKIGALGLKDRVHLLGKIPYERLPLYYRASDVVLHPARWEGYGLVALEALAAGTPVVAADVGGLRDVIESGVNGILVEPNPKKLAGALRTILLDEELRRRMGEVGRVQALGRTWERVAEEYLELIAEVLG